MAAAQAYEEQVGQACLHILQLLLEVVRGHCRSCMEWQLKLKVQPASSHCKH